MVLCMLDWVFRTHDRLTCGRWGKKTVQCSVASTLISCLCVFVCVRCIAAELFLGLPLFPGSSEYDQMRRIVKMRDLPPPAMLRRVRLAVFSLLSLCLIILVFTGQINTQIFHSHCAVL